GGHMIYSAIDIGANAIEIKIVSFSGKKPELIDCISTPIRIGKEVYTSEYISSGSVSAMISILLSYQSILRDYHVEDYKVIATGALRNAKNASQVIEIMRMKTGFEIEILESPVENFITYKALKNKLKNYEAFRQGAIIVDTHSGSTDITVYSKGRLISNDTVKMGSQIAVPYIDKVISMIVDYPKVVGDYLSTLTRRAQKKIVNRNISYLLLLGTAASELSDLFFDGREEIPAEEFLEIHRRVMAKDYELEKKAGDRWQRLLFIVVLSGIFLNATDASSILMPRITLSDGVLADFVERGEMRSEARDEDIFDAATEIARRFKCKIKHIRHVESHVRNLFRALEHTLDMNEDDFFTLRLAVHMVEIGKSLRRSGYEKASFDMLKHLDIFGVKRAVLDEIGYIALEIENIFSSDVNKIVHTVHSRKIAALIAVGLALDIDNLQQIRIEYIHVEEDCVSITISGQEFKSSMIAMEPVKEAFLDCFGYELRIVEELCC
ncbi:MAG: hypothetical protein Q4A41_05470, partial [Bacillota bacterium]|nr:hypothetical protein [Bacillota bacterium]